MLRVLLCLLILCAACAPPPANGEVVPPGAALLCGCGEVITLAQAQQTNAPALAISSGGVIAAWIGSDERGVHQDARRLNTEGLTEIVTLPLPPTHPYGQRLFPGGGNSTHLLWLDADDEGQTALFSALLSPDLVVERGPVSVSEGLALDYSAVPDGTRGLWAAWSGGLLGEMTLSVRRIDDAGRPLVQTTTIAAAAEHPALLRTAAGEVWLFWLGEGQLLRQRLDPPGETGAQALTGAVSLAPGDRLIDVSVGLDWSSAYFFWNITRTTGKNETWFTAGSLAASAWRQPQRLRIAVGSPTAAAGNEFSLRWTMPLSGQADTLSAVTKSDAGLALLDLSGGTLVGYKLLVPGARLLGLPALAADSTGMLYLAWAAPGDESASLQLITVRDG